MTQSSSLAPSLKEPVVHGDILSPYTFHHCSIPQTFRDLLAHWHDEAEITIIREGSSNYHIASSSYYVTKGDLLVISPNVLHSIHEIANTTMVSDTLVFHMNLLGCHTPDNCSLKYFIPIQKNIYSITPVIHPQDSGYSALLSCMETIMECISPKKYFALSSNSTSGNSQSLTGYEIVLKEQLFHLFFLLYEHGYVQTSVESLEPEIRDEKIKHALSYMQTNYKDSIRISDLAKLCNFSEVHFMNLFKKAVGSSCIDYLNYYRLNQAASLLKSSEDSVLNIALECGFTNISYFNRQFRSKFHMTPSDYRKKDVENI